MNSTTLLKRIDRIVVWGLLTLFLVFMISGYMITKGFIDRYYGLLLHTELDLSIMALFTVHFGINLKFILARWGIKNGVVVNLVPAIIGFSLFLFILYLDQFFRL